MEQWESFRKCARTIGYPCGKNKLEIGPCLTSHTKVNSRLIKGLDVQGKVRAFRRKYRRMSCEGKGFFKRYEGGFPGGAVVENLPANAGDTGSSPGLGGSHMPRSN